GTSVVLREPWGTSPTNVTVTSLPLGALAKTPMPGVIAVAATSTGSQPKVESNEATLKLFAVVSQTNTWKPLGTWPPKIASIRLVGAVNGLEISANPPAGTFVLT